MSKTITLKPISVANAFGTILTGGVVDLRWRKSSRRNPQQHDLWSRPMKRIAWRMGIGLVILVAVGGLGVLLLRWLLTPSDVEAAEPVALSGSTSSVERTIDSGILAGVRDSNILIFKGIPYAAPPVDELRWRPPLPPENWEGRRNASQFGNDCWQVRTPSDPARSTQPMSEDCLTINVWAPVNVPEGGAPVMFWIHGGGFVQGSSSQPALDGSEFARRGVVLVSFNYRLGRFGFFAHPALNAEVAGGPTGNWGLMDQVAALQWVNRNIESFGGDPHRVTMFGQSAGGASVAQLMLDPKVRGLFSAGIIQSSGGRNRWVPMQSEDKKAPSGLAAGQQFAAGAGLGDGSAKALRALTPETLVGGLSLAKLDPKTFSGPIIDGQLVKSDFVEGFIEGRQADVPLMIGSTERELSHLNFLARWGLRQWAKNVLGDQLDTVRASYPSHDAFDDHIVNDWGFAEPARIMAASHAERGYSAWLYSFDYVSSARRNELDGAPHASDVTFVFGTLGREGVSPDAEDWQMSSTIRDYWLAFARDGAPDAPDRPTWPLYARSADHLLRFTQSGPKVDGVRRSRELDAIGQAMGIDIRR